MLIEQMLPKPKQKKLVVTKSKKQSGAGEGPKVQKNKNNRNVVLNAEMTQVQAMLQKLLKLIGDTLQPIYFVYDGAFGNNAAVQMTRQVGLHLISNYATTLPCISSGMESIPARGGDQFMVIELIIKTFPQPI